MSTGDGNPGGRPGRQVRADGAPARPAPDESEGGVSGRVVVTAAVLGLLALWGGLNLAFRQWRAGYRERAEYGARRVAAAVDPLAELVPAGEVPPAVRASACAGAAAVAAAASPLDAPPGAWRRAVAETHAMLVTLTAANLLDRPQMDDLAGRIGALVAAARPETARPALASVWSDAEAKAGHVLDRHPRPDLLPPRPETETRPR